MTLEEYLTSLQRDFPTNPLITEVLGPDHPIPGAWNMLVETYNRGQSFKKDDGTESVFERPDESKDADRYQLCVGRVLFIGDACFKGPTFQYVKLIPQVGDYVDFQRYQGIYKSFNTPNGVVECQYLRDTDYLAIVPNPDMCGYIHYTGN